VTGPLTRLDVTELPREGRAVLRFTATALPGAPAVAFTEYRVDKGRWRRGDSVEVLRRRIWSHVRYRSVDVAGVRGPVQVWEKDWPGLRADALPQGSTHFVATYDWFRLRDGERWWLDHPVGLVFRRAPVLGRRSPLRREHVPAPGLRASSTSRPSLSSAAIEETLRRIGFRSRVYDLVRGLDLASDGGLALADGETPDPYAPTAVTQGVKLRLDPANLQSSVHVRVYGPPAGGFDDPELGVWLPGSCHIDVNELMRVEDGVPRWGAGLPRGAPAPPIDADLIKYGGNSEWAEAFVADLWERAFGRRYVRRGAIAFGDPQDWFQLAGSGTHQGRSWAVGKWWLSDGRATVLTLPDRALSGSALPS
jgi:hypothetical protein